MKSAEQVDSKNFGNFRRILTLYRLFRDLARDIRSTKFDPEHIVIRSKQEQKIFLKLSKNTQWESALIANRIFLL